MEGQQCGSDAEKAESTRFHYVQKKNCLITAGQEELQMFKGAPDTLEAYCETGAHRVLELLKLSHYKHANESGIPSAVVDELNCP